MPPNCMYGVSALDAEDHTRKQHKPGPLGRDFGYVSANCCTSYGPTQKAYCIPRRQEKPDICIRLSNKNPSSRHEKQPFELLMGESKKILTHIGHCCWPCLLPWGWSNSLLLSTSSDTRLWGFVLDLNRKPPPWGHTSCCQRKEAIICVSLLPSL